MRTTGAREERQQRIHVAVFGVHHDLVETEPSEQFASRLSLGRDPRRKRATHLRIRRVDLHDLTRFRIFQSGRTDIGQCPFRRIFQRDGNDIVPLRETRQRLLQIVREKIGREKDHRPMRQQSHEPIHHGRHGRAPSRRTHREQIANEAQGMFASLARGEGVFDPVGEQHESHAVVVAHRGQ